MFKKVWSADMVESHIYMAHSNKEPLNSHYYATHYPSVYAAAERLFGSWGEAITACGFNYDEIRKYKVWNRSKVTETIREMAAAGKPVSSQKAQQDHKSLYMAAIRYYRSWGKAVMAAGIDYSTIREPQKHVGDGDQGGNHQALQGQCRPFLLQHACKLPVSSGIRDEKARRGKLGRRPQSLRNQDQLPDSAGETSQETSCGGPGSLKISRKKPSGSCEEGERRNLPYRNCDRAKQAGKRGKRSPLFLS